MSGESNFPSSKSEALTLIYIQSQDLSGKSPEDLADLYADTYARVRTRFRDLRQEQRETN